MNHGATTTAVLRYAATGHEGSLFATVQEGIFLRPVIARGELVSAVPRVPLLRTIDHPAAFRHQYTQDGMVCNPYFMRTLNVDEEEKEDGVLVPGGLCVVCPLFKPMKTGWERNRGNVAAGRAAHFVSSRGNGGSASPLQRVEFAENRSALPERQTTESEKDQEETPVWKGTDASAPGGSARATRFV